MRRRRKYKWESEEAMAAHVVAWLRKHGWAVYEEIQGIDIIALRPDGFLWCIEAKRTMGLQVLAQAERHKPYADAVSVAVPGERRTRAAHFGCHVARKFGIGIIEVVSPDRGLDELVHPWLEPEPLDQHALRGYYRGVRAKIEACLTPEAQEAGNRAGQANQGGWSPFKQTVHRLLAFVKTHPRPTLKEAVAGIEHHYGSPASARSSLSRLFGGPAIPNLRLVYDRARKKHVIEEIADA